MPGGRGRRAIQERIPLRLLGTAWHSHARAGAGQRVAAGSLGKPVRSAGERGGLEHDRPFAQRKVPGHRSAADSAALVAANLTASVVANDRTTCRESRTANRESRTAICEQRTANSF